MKSHSMVERSRLEQSVLLLIAILITSTSLNAQGYKVSKALSKPIVFNEGNISTSDGYETHPSFTPSGDTIYFLRCAPDLSWSTIYFSIKNGGNWSTPEVVPFSGKYFDADPFITKDGNTLYFTSNRPINQRDPAKEDTDVWKVEKKNGSSWGTPVRLESAVNSPSNEHYPTIADNGNMYFGSERSGGKGGSDIYCAKYQKGEFTEVKNLGELVNSANSEYEPFIASDESYLIFMATIPKGLANADLYISYNEKGNWTSPKKLDDAINSIATEWAPKVTRDNRYFFFGSTRDRKQNDPGKKGLSDIYQVDATILKLKE